MLHECSGHFAFTVMPCSDGWMGHECFRYFSLCVVDSKEKRGASWMSKWLYSDRWSERRHGTCTALGGFLSSFLGW